MGEQIRRHAKRKRRAKESHEDPARTRTPQNLSSQRPAWTRARWLAFLILLVIGAISRLRYLPYCIHDDAFISFRYARNLARGEGLVMNPGERVEGVTNFLWTLLAVPSHTFGLDPEIGMQALGFALSLLLVLGVFVFSERRLGSGWLSLVAPTFLIGNLAFVMESLSGLETLAFACLVFMGYVSFLEERRNGTIRDGLWVSFCAAATLVRPEGALIFAILASYTAFGTLRGEPIKHLARLAGLYVLLIAPFILWRVFYYDSWLPNTFYTKVGFTLAQLSRGWRYTVVTLGFGLTLPFLIVLIAMTLWTWIHSLRPVTRSPRRSDWIRVFVDRPRDEAIAVAFTISLVYALYVMGVGGDYEPTARFYMPILALVYLLFQEALRSLKFLSLGRSRWIATLATVATVLFFAWTLYKSEERFMRILQARGWPLSRHEHHLEQRSVGEWLQRNLPSQSLIALSSIGALPYYADHPIIDMMGLTDRHIGRRKMPNMGLGPAGHEKGDGLYVLNRQPDLILLDKGHLFREEATLEQVLQGARGISELEIVNSPFFLQNYGLHRSQIPAGILHYFQRIPRESRD